MKTTTSFRFLFLFLIAALSQSCSPKDVLRLMPEGSADFVHSYFFGPSYGNPYGNGGSASEASSLEIGFNVAVYYIMDCSDMIDYSQTDYSSIDRLKPHSGSLLASNRPGFQPGLYRPFRPARPKTDGAWPFIIKNFFLMPGLELATKGGIQKDAGGNEKTNLLYLELPIYAVYHYELPNKGRIIAGFGPYVGYGLTGKFKSTFNGQTFSNPAFGNNGGFKRFDAGLALTAGYELPSSLRIRLAYELGLANIESGPAGGFGDKTYNRAISLNVGYPLAKIIAKVKNRKRQ